LAQPHCPFHCWGFGEEESTLIFEEFEFEGKLCFISSFIPMWIIFFMGEQSFRTNYKILSSYQSCSDFLVVLTYGPD